MRPRDVALFTLNEASALTRLPLKVVHNAVDKRIVTSAEGARAGHATRVLGSRALLFLTLERRLIRCFATRMRRDVFDALAAEAHPRDSISLDAGFLTIDLREPRRELAQAMWRLRRARALVRSDPEVMGGDPVFQGTRVSVHMIANMLTLGDGENDLLESYPSLTVEMIRLAPLYAAAYQLRGRPRARPRHGKPPIHVASRPLSDYDWVT